MRHPLDDFTPDEQARFDADIAVLRHKNEETIQLALGMLELGHSPTATVVHIAGALGQVLGMVPGDRGYEAARLLAVLHVDLALQRGPGA